MTERDVRKPPSDELVTFKTALGRVRNEQGTRITLVTFANDTVSGYKQTYSEVAPLRPGDKLKEALDELILIMVPEGESRQTLEEGFNQGPDRIKGDEYHHNEAVSEWQTVFDNVVIGIEATRDQRSESSRSWYLRNTSRD